MVRVVKLSMLVMIALFGLAAIATAQDTSENPWLVYLATMGGHTDIYRVRLDGSDPQNLTQNVESVERLEALSTDQEWIYFQGIGDVYRMRLDGSDLQNLTQSAAGDASFAAFSPDQQWIYFHEAWHIYRVTADGRERQQLTHMGVNTFMKMSPDGEWIFFVRAVDDNYYGQDIYRMRSDGRDVSLIPNILYFPSYSRWLSDGAWLYYQSDNNIVHALHRMSADGSIIEDLTGSLHEHGIRFGIIDLSRDLSPDGEWFVFTCEAGMRYSICRMRLDGSEPQELTHFNAINTFVAWLPDDQGILFTSAIKNASGDGDLYRMRLDGSGKQKLTDFPVPIRFIDYTFDGNQMLIWGMRADKGRDLYRINLDGNEAETIISTDQTLFFNEFSPNGQWMLFSSAKNETSDVELYRARPDGTQFEKITSEPGYHWKQRWTPDGTSFLYVLGEYSSTDYTVTGHLYSMNIDTLETQQLSADPGPYVFGSIYVVEGP